MNMYIQIQTYEHIHVYCKSYNNINKGEKIAHSARLHILLVSHAYIFVLNIPTCLFHSSFLFVRRKVQIKQRFSNVYRMPDQLVFTRRQ